MSFSLSSYYASLPDILYERRNPTPVASPHLLAFNHALATELQLDVSDMDDDTLAAYFSGNRIAEHSTPIAQAYAGHQFGHFVPQLGDGRAVLLGEAQHIDGTLRDVQLKGSGKTRFSRRGDGRAPLGAAIREYMVSEAMHALGVSTTRALALTATGEIIYRETPVPGGIITRVASSHIRVGTFEYLASQEQWDTIDTLVNFALQRHYPHYADAPIPALALLQAVSDAQAALVAHWMQLGFIHGVMNTDNCTISGETIDYGPCAFMEAYEPAMVFSSIDQLGRYAYNKQPYIAQWNLMSLAETLSPIITRNDPTAINSVQDVIERFPETFEEHFSSGMFKKIGITHIKEEDNALLQSLLQLMQREQADFTLTFRRLGHTLGDDDTSSDAFLSLFNNTPDALTWLTRWHARIQQETSPNIQEQMQRLNPAYIPRNHLVERAIEEVESHGSLALMEQCLDVWRHPYSEKEATSIFSLPATTEERVTQTFCGT